MRKCTNTEWGVIRNFVRIVWDLWILDEFKFFNFLYRDIKFLKLEEAKIKQHNSAKKKRCEIGEEAIWESRCTSFFFSLGVDGIFLSYRKVFKFLTESYFCWEHTFKLFLSTWSWRLAITSFHMSPKEFRSCTFIREPTNL